MLQRIFVMLIVGFWLAMTGLLIVREVFPEATRLTSVPVGFVGGLFFQHGQSSDLQIYDAGKEVGYAHLQPRVTPDKQERALDFHGMVTLNPLGMAKQRLSWNGHVTLSPKNDLKRLRVVLSTEEPANHLDVLVDAQAKTAKFIVRTSGGQVVDQSTISLDREGMMKLISRIGIEPVTLQQLMSSSAATPEGEITAAQSSTRMNGETISTYLVSIKVSGQTLLEAHVSQLGQVLRAEAPIFGYKLAPYNIAP
jgi:hypothetical protein